MVVFMHCGVPTLASVQRKYFSRRMYVGSCSFYESHFFLTVENHISPEDLQEFLNTHSGTTTSGYATTSNLDYADAFQVPFIFIKIT